MLLRTYRPRRAAASAAIAISAALALPACRPAAPAFGATRESAAVNAATFFHGLAARFTNVTRTPKFAAARSRLSRHALSPSGIFGDTAVWTAASADTRTLTLSGRLRGNRYVFDASSAAPVPRQPGDSWHLMRLRSLGDDQYEWATAVDHDVGSATPDELLGVWRALLATAARTPAPLLRTEYRTAFPRATAAMGRLASLDSLDRRPLRDGSAVLVLHVSLHPERLRARHPHLARFVVKYVQPARYAFTFSDRGGNRWITMSARQNRLVFQLRALPDGRLAPLEGPVRPLPDTLVLRGEAHAKFSVFTVGISDLEADVAMIGTGTERGWDFRFRDEPDWHFPLAVNNLIRTALRRPFEGEGARLRLVLQRRPDGQTLIARRVVATVQEGAIVRWLGGLGAGAMSDYAGQAEEDENRFTVDVLSALGDDFAALLR
ncbi:MAG TPA: hypothetical protein VGE02_06855 [Gemmatimonadales bacterium]